MIIERLIILHLNLVELCTGRSIDETATDEELIEPILFFYSSSFANTTSSTGAPTSRTSTNKNNNNKLDTTGTRTNNYTVQNGSCRNTNSTTTTTLNTTSSSFPVNDRNWNIAEAIQFSGLCAALYSLPQSVSCCKANNNSNCTTRASSEIHLNHCILVFQRIEEQNVDQNSTQFANKKNCNHTVNLETQQSPIIIAVAQISKSNKCNVSSEHSNSFFSSSSSRSSTANIQPTGTPAAVADAIKKSHELFCLLQSGGIHERLLRKQQQHLWDEYDHEGTNGKSSDGKNSIHGSDCLYGNVGRLLELRRLARKLSEQIQRHDDDDDDSDDDDEKNEHSSNNETTAVVSNRLNEKQSQLYKLQQEITELYAQLPLRSLKDELRVHYETFLEDRQQSFQQEVSILQKKNQHGFNSSNNKKQVSTLSSSYGFYRHIVESVPPPLPKLSGDHVQFSAPLVSLHQQQHQPEKQLLHTTIQNLLSSMTQAQIAPFSPHLLGVTSFVHGQLLFQCTHTENADEDESDSSINNFTVSNETSIQLMYYLTKFQFQKQQNKGYDGNSIDTASFGFLEPPPLSLLSSSENIGDNVFLGPQNMKMVSSPTGSSSAVLIEDSEEYVIMSFQTIWVPSAWLPFTNDHNQYTRYHVRLCCFHWNDFSFLLYMNYIPYSDANDGIYQPLLAKFQNQVVTCCLDLLGHGRNNNAKEQKGSPSKTQSLWNKMTSFQVRTWDEPGQTILAVDMKLQSLTLFLDSLTTTTTNNKNQPIRNYNATNNNMATKNKRGGINFLFFKDRGGGNSSSSSTKPSLSSSSFDGSVNVDCRHELASQLSVSSLLALEDAMAVLRENRIKRTTPTIQPTTTTTKDPYDATNNALTSVNKTKSTVPFEMCTLTSTHWVYAFATTNDEEKELYVLFDNSQYVTVVDVQIGAQMIRSELLGL